VPLLLYVVYTFHDIFYLRYLEGVPFFFEGPFLVANFGRTILAWDSMGKEFHSFDVVGSHIGSQIHALGGLHEIMEDLITQTIFLGEPKRHLLMIDVMLEGV
jgi:hypothetical protein